MRLTAMLCCSLLVIPACATTATSAKANIRHLERDIEAAAARGDTAFLERVLSPDFEMTHGTGRVEGREGWLKVVAFRPFVSRTITVKNVDVRDNRATSTGVIVIVRIPRPTEHGRQQYSIDYIREYQRIDGTWKLTRHTTTRETAPVPAR